MSVDDTPRSHRASSGIDFTSVTDGVALFPNGSSRAWISLEILNDTLPELEESFQVVLTSVAVVSNLSSLSTPSSFVNNYNFHGSASNNKPSLAPHGSRLNITIKKNDFPYGLFMLTTNLMIPLLNDSRKIVITEPDKEQKLLRVNIHIERTKGTYFIDTQ